jgi:hypothetical protein
MEAIETRKSSRTGRYCFLGLQIERNCGALVPIVQLLVPNFEERTLPRGVEQMLVWPSRRSQPKTHTPGFMNTRKEIRTRKELKKVKN